MTTTISANPRELAVAVRAAMKADVIEAAGMLRDIQEQTPHLLHEVRRAASIGRRKAYALIQADRCFSSLNVNPSNLRRLGWTKLAVLAPHVTEQNVQQLLAMAEENTVHGLKVLLSGGEISDDYRVVLMYLTPKQYEVFEAVLLKHGAAKEGRGLTGKEYALTEVLTAAAAQETGDAG